MCFKSFKIKKVLLITTLSMAFHIAFDQSLNNHKMAKVPEPWPTAANNSLISWPNIPKPAYYQVKNACRPVMSSASIQKFTWTSGESFKTTVWMLNDSPEKIAGGTLRVSFVSTNEKKLIGIWDHEAINPNENLKGPELHITIPDWNEGQIKLILEEDGRPELNSEYILLMKN